MCCSRNRTDIQLLFVKGNFSQNNDRDARQEQDEILSGRFACRQYGKWRINIKRFRGHSFGVWGRGEGRKQPNSQASVIATDKPRPGMLTRGACEADLSPRWSTAKHAERTWTDFYESLHVDASAVHIHRLLTIPGK